MRPGRRKASWRAPVLPVYLLFVKTSPFALNEPYYGNSASMKLYPHSGFPRHHQRRGKVPGQNLERRTPVPESRHYAG
jgi:hypothetical protein